MPISFVGHSVMVHPLLTDGAYPDFLRRSHLSSLGSVDILWTVRYNRGRRTQGRSIVLEEPGIFERNAFRRLPLDVFFAVTAVKDDSVRIRYE